MVGKIKLIKSNFKKVGNNKIQYAIRSFKIMLQRDL